MPNYIDGYVFPLSRIHLNKYKQVAEQVAEIWKEYGALNYFEKVGDAMDLEGTLSFSEILGTNETELIIFGWIEFESRESRDLAHKQVAADSRMANLVAPLMELPRIFDPQKMAYGGFNPFIG